MKFLIALWEINPLRTAKKLGRYMASQELARKFKKEYTALQKEKPVYTPLSKLNQ